MSVPNRRRHLKLSGGSKLVLIVGGLGLGLWIGWTYAVGFWLKSKHFAPLIPGKVSLIGLKTGRGFTIQVSNRMAQLVEAKDHDFAAPGEDSDGGAEGASKKRIPVDDLVHSLQGDEAALSRFVTTLGGFEPSEDWPAHAPVWAAEDIQKALAGDTAMRGKLEHDLATKLDGTPVAELSTAALSRGIIVETPAPVKVQVGADVKELHARVKRWYQTRLAIDTSEKFKELFHVSAEAQLGYYLSAAREELAADKLENVTGALQSLISPSGLKDATDRAELILGSAQVILTDAYIEKASSSPSAIGSSSSDSKSASGMFDLDIHVTDEGRLRLWQYSKLHPLDQLLLVSNGVAIAAPRIRQELMTHDLTIAQMPDEGLVDEAVETINNKK